MVPSGLTGPFEETRDGETCRGLNTFLRLLRHSRGASPHVGHLPLYMWADPPRSWVRCETGVLDGEGFCLIVMGHTDPVTWVFVLAVATEISFA